MIVDTHFAPNITVPGLRQLKDNHPIDPLHVFSQKCREELSARQSPIVHGSTKRAPARRQGRPEASQQK
jgi:hypothetical protein